MKNPFKGWFTGLGRDGDRDVNEQMQGLEQLLREVPGKTVLDAGCAEGLVSIELAKAGAAAVHGLEIVDNYIGIAQKLAADAGVPCTFEQANLNYYEPGGRRFDIVLMGAILHKLKNPSAVCSVLAGVCDDLCVIRLPPTGPLIRDLRSEMVPHDILTVMASEGFTLESEGEGPRNEWQGYFRRVRHVQEMPISVHVEPDVSKEPDFLNTAAAVNEEVLVAAEAPVALDVTTVADAAPVVMPPEAPLQQAPLVEPDSQERQKRRYTRRGQ